MRFEKVYCIEEKFERKVPYADNREAKEACQELNK